MSELRLRFLSDRQLGPGDPILRDSIRVLADCDWSTANGAPACGGRPFTLRFETRDISSLRWYLEQYVRHPEGGFVFRAREVEQTLVQWAGELLPAALGPDWAAMADALIGMSGMRRLTIETDMSSILTLPWELAAWKGRSLVEHGVIIRRCPTPTDRSSAVHCTPPPPGAKCLRVLLVVSRPDGMGYFDHCRTARIMDKVARDHPGRLQIHYCLPATAARFERMVAQADAEGHPYGVIHFDGHGVYNTMMRRGELCFEAPADSKGDVAVSAMPAKAFKQVLIRNTRPALLVFEACQTSQVTPPLMGSYSPQLWTLRDLRAWFEGSGLKPSFENCVDLTDTMSPGELRANAAVFFREGLGSAFHDRDLADIPVERSIVGAALDAGVASIIGMSHAVHVDATACFTEAFYSGLAEGCSVGAAVHLGRKALMRSKTRRTAKPGATHPDTVNLEDWFVPQLYQLGEDHQLEPVPMSRRTYPKTAMFFGRGEELLAAERRLLMRPAVLVCGLAGVGKTAFARKLAGWMANSGQFPDGVYWLPAGKPMARMRRLDEMHHAMRSPSDFTAASSGGRTPLAPPASWSELKLWLDSRRCLVVMDAVEKLICPNPAASAASSQSAEFRLFMGEWMQGGEAAGRILMTTRLGRDNPLPVLDSDIIELKGLPVADATALLVLRLAQNGHGDVWAGLDAEVRMDLLNRLGGNPHVIETAAGHWPESARDLRPEALDHWMAEWGMAEWGTAEGTPSPPPPGWVGDLGLAACPVESLPQDARRILGLIGLFRGAISPAHIGRLNPPTPDQWRAAIDAWARIGLVTSAEGDPAVHRLHPWLPYRLQKIQPESSAQPAAEAVASLYEVLFYEISYARPWLPHGYHQWLGAEWANLRLQFQLAVGHHQAERALSVGLMIDELLNASGRDDARLRLIRLMEKVRQEQKLDAVGLEARLRTCDWAMANRQRNDAVNMAAATLIELEGEAAPQDSALLARVLVDLGDVFKNSGYGYAAMRVYCRGCAIRIDRISKNPEARRSEAFHLATGLRRIAEVLFTGRTVKQAWDFIRRQFMVLTGALGGGRIPMAPLVGFARLLVWQRKFDQAERLFETMLKDTGSLDDRSLAAWFESRGDLAARRKRFDDAANMCLRALSIYNYLGDRRAVLLCHQHMGGICTGTGRHNEAQSWFRSALDMAWQQADASGAQRLIVLMRNADSTVIQGLAVPARKDIARQFVVDRQPYYDEQVARLNGLEAYCAETDPAVRRAVGIRRDDSPSKIPQGFSAAAEIVRLLGAEKEITAEGAGTPPPAGQILDARLAPTDPQAASTCFLSLAMLEAQLNPKAPT